MDLVVFVVNGVIWLFVVCVFELISKICMFIHRNVSPKFIFLVVLAIYALSGSLEGWKKIMAAKIPPLNVIFFFLITRSGVYYPCYIVVVFRPPLWLPLYPLTTALSAMVKQTAKKSVVTVYDFQWWFLKATISVACVGLVFL